MKPPRKSATPGRKKRRIGVLERVSIPEWGLHAIEARVDTGAFTSSIDVRAVHVVPGAVDDRGRQLATISFDDGRGRRSLSVPVLGFRKVRNPSGGVTSRPFVEAVIVLAGRRFRTPINLHRREGMTYRMLIGRRALTGRFVVDVDRPPR